MSKCAIVSACETLGRGEEVTDKPNIIFMMPDQLRHDFLSCYGASFVDTPNIDALCAQGIRYQNAYS